MTFWSEANMAPMRNYRWQLDISGFTGNTVVWWAKTVNVPSFDVTETSHDYFDNKYYFPGRVTWSDVEVQLVDPVSPSAVSLTNTILEKAGYNIPTKAGGKETISKSKSTTAGLGDVVLTLMDVDGNPIETWTLKNAFIKAAKFGDMDYANDDLRTVNMTLKYDWATCEIGNKEFFKAKDPS